MTRIYIITDLEGVSGLYDISQIFDVGTEHFQAGLERLVVDTNAAIRGAFDGGADEVIVTDGHGSGKNFSLAKTPLDERAIVMPTWDVDFRTMKVDALMHVGTHAKAGTQCAFLDHTQSSKTIFNYTINGRHSGELVQAALWAGAYDIPYIFVSGDQAACDEGIEFFGNIVTAPVKYCIERNKAICMPDDEAEKLIYEKAKASMSLIGTNRVRPYKVSMPMEVVQEYTRADYADAVYNLKTDLDRLDARTLRKVVNKIEVYKDVKF
nr:M55 family metallopeptidase [Clostridia bacterium]